MDREWVVRDEAKEFSRKIESYEVKYKGHEEFKKELGYKILDFDELEDRLIFLYEILKALETKFEKHELKCEFTDKPEECPNNRFFWKAIYYAEQHVKELNPSHDFKIFRPMLQADLIHENLIGLSNYPAAGKLYQSALDKINENRFERNLLDDLRLSLETLLKCVLGNEKSLEKQDSVLGEWLKEKGASKECSNMLRKLIEYFSKYQNQYVKHNDKVNRQEVDLITNLTSSFMAFVLNI